MEVLRSESLCLKSRFYPRCPAFMWVIVSQIILPEKPARRGSTLWTRRGGSCRPLKRWSPRLMKMGGWCFISVRCDISDRALLVYSLMTSCRERAWSETQGGQLWERRSSSSDRSCFWTVFELFLPHGPFCLHPDLVPSPQPQAPFVTFIIIWRECKVKARSTW